MNRTEAIEVIRKCWPVNRNGMLSEALKTLIPELNESEDERIIEGFKGLLRGIKEKGGLTLNMVSIEKCEAWLERQKEPENKSASTMAPSCWEVKQKEQKPAEWSEEDEKKIYFLSRLIEFQVKNDEYCFSEGRFVSKKEAIKMLKSLRPSWKPSEEQMEALMLAIEGKCAPTSYMSRRLEDLYEALVNEFHVECKLDK